MPKSNQTVSLAPQPKQPIQSVPKQEQTTRITPQVFHTIDTNKSYTFDSNANIRDVNGNLMQPIYNNRIINGIGGGLSNILPANLPPKAVAAIQKGYNENAVETDYALNPLYASKDAKNIAAAAAQNYVAKNGIILDEPKDVEPKYVTKDGNYGGYWNGYNTIYISPGNQQADRNGTLIHEVEHSMQSKNQVLVNTPTVNRLYDTVIQNKSYPINQPNITGANPQTDLLKQQLNSPLYKNITQSDRDREIEAHYIDQYYSRQQPRNDIVDNYEKNLGINTARQLTPDENRQFTSAINTLTNQARDMNDNTTGIFKPINKSSSFMQIRV